MASEDEIRLRVRSLALAKTSGSTLPSKKLVRRENNIGITSNKVYSNSWPENDAVHENELKFIQHHTRPSVAVCMQVVLLVLILQSYDYPD